MSAAGPRERDDRGRAQNARPRDRLGRPLPRGAEGVPRVPEDYAAPPGAALAEAQRLLDAGMPFHAHEVLEAVWKAAPAGERDLWQGLAQLAVGLTHHLRGNARGSAVLLRRGRSRVEPWAGGGPRAADGGAPALVDVDGLLAWSGRLLAVVEDGGSVVPPGGGAPWVPRSPRLRRRPPDDPRPAVRLERRALTSQEAAAVAAWRYPPELARHELGPTAREALQRRSADGREGFEPVLDGQGTVVAHLCLGVEATVAGQPHRRGTPTTGSGPRSRTPGPDEREPGGPPGEVLDVGLGVRPDLLGAGVGTQALSALVAALREEARPPAHLRAVARAADGRALGVLARLGLAPRARFTRPDGDGEAFVELRGALADLGR